MIGTYNHGLVALSVIIAVLSAYAALDLTGRVTSARGRARYLWLSGGATAMAIGIWSMHCLGMLAFELPVPVQYDWPTVAASTPSDLNPAATIFRTSSLSATTTHVTIPINSCWDTNKFATTNATKVFHCGPVVATIL
jgi:NO-binding membrane sensor protein with MHYT domain